MLPTPQTVLADRYALIEPVHDRGLGETWRARDLRREGAIVQVKFLRAMAGEEIDPDALKVIHALRALRHPAIPSVVNHGALAGRPWVASYDVQGDSVGTRLDQARARGEALDLAVIRQVFDGVVAAMSAAHTAPLPVLHGALTPGSVVVLAKAPRGPACALLDLGLARWLDPPPDAPARSARTLIARAPEVARGGAPDVATDVFSLGALLTEMLALPASLGETMIAVHAGRRRADVPPGVWRALERAMQLEPAQRFPTVEALAAALAAAWTEPLARARPEPVLAAPAREPVVAAPPREPAPRPAAWPPEALPGAPRPQSAPMAVTGTPPARPADWQNPWDSVLIQAQVPSHLGDVDDPMMQTLVDRVSAAPPPGLAPFGDGPMESTLPVGVASGSAFDVGGPRARATLLRAPGPSLAPPPGTLLAAPRPREPEAHAGVRAIPPSQVSTIRLEGAPSPRARSLRVALLVAGFALAVAVVAVASYRLASG